MDRRNFLGLAAGAVPLMIPSTKAETPKTDDLVDNSPRGTTAKILVSLWLKSPAFLITVPVTSLQLESFSHYDPTDRTIMTGSLKLTVSHGGWAPRIVRAVMTEFADVTRAIRRSLEFQVSSGRATPTVRMRNVTLVDLSPMRDTNRLVFVGSAEDPKTCPLGGGQLRTVITDWD